MGEEAKKQKTAPHFLRPLFATSIYAASGALCEHKMTLVEKTTRRRRESRKQSRRNSRWTAKATLNQLPLPKKNDPLLLRLRPRTLALRSQIGPVKYFLSSNFIDLFLYFAAFVGLRLVNLRGIVPLTVRKE